MTVSRTSLFKPTLLALLLASPLSALACASCGCTLSSDWESQGLSASSGFKLDLRYDYLNQNQLRSGTHAISAAAASAIMTPNGSQEVERYTRNDYVTATLDYSPNAAWGVAVQLSYINRGHSTLGTASDGSTAGPGGGQYDANTSGLGDVRVIGRYQGFNAQHNIGVSFGLKLPTGSHSRTGISTDPTNPGPVAIDRGLQPGTGTTDLIVGVYAFDALNRDWDYFAQATYQAALDSKDQYKPGDGENANLGLRYQGFERAVPQLQLNLRHVARDRGQNADQVSTGGTLAYLSPGVVVPVGKQTSIYGFVQLPVYQNVNGVQLAPRYTASIGARFSF